MQPSLHRSSEPKETQPANSQAIQLSTQALNLEIAKRFLTTGEQDIAFELLAINSFGSVFSDDCLWQEAATSKELFEQEKELRTEYRILLQQGDTIREKLRHAGSDEEISTIVEEELTPLHNALSDFTERSIEHDMRVCDAAEVLAEEELQAHLQYLQNSASSGIFPSLKVFEKLTDNDSSPEAQMREQNKEKIESFRDPIIHSGERLKDYFRALAKCSEAPYTDLNSTLAALYQNQFHRIQLPETRSPRAHVPQAELTLALGSMIHSCRELTFQVESRMGDTFGRDSDLFGRIGERSYSQTRSAEIMSQLSSSLDVLRIELEATGELSVHTYVPDELKQEMIDAPEGINTCVTRLNTFLAPYGGSVEILADETDAITVRAILRVDYEGEQTLELSKKKIALRKETIMSAPGTVYTRVNRELAGRSTPYQIQILSELLESNIARQRIQQILTHLDKWVESIPAINEIFVHSQNPYTDHDVDLDGFEGGENAQIYMDSDLRDSINSRYNILTNIVDLNLPKEPELENTIPDLHSSSIHIETDEEGLRSTKVREEVTRLWARCEPNVISAYGEQYQQLAELYNTDQLDLLVHVLASLREITEQTCAELNVKTPRLRIGHIEASYSSPDTNETLAILAPAFKVFDQDKEQPVTEGMWNLDDGCLNYWPVNYDLSLTTGSSLIKALEQLDAEDVFFASKLAYALQENGILMEDAFFPHIRSMLHQKSGIPLIASTVLSAPRLGLFKDPESEITQVKYLTPSDVKRGRKV